MQIEAASNISKNFKMTKFLRLERIFCRKCHRNLSILKPRACPTFWAFDWRSSLKVMELWHFQYLSYFVTSWPSYLTYILVQRTCKNHELVLPCDQVWWLLTDSFLRFCESSVQTDRQTNRQTWPTNILAKMVILASKRNDIWKYNKKPWWVSVCSQMHHKRKSVRKHTGQIW